MNEECNSQAGQLDLLWEQFGGRVVENNPNDARDSDMLNKQGTKRFIKQLTGGAIVGISKIDDPNDKRKNIVIAKTLNGESVTLYSFEKEDYLKKVTIRKTTQQDVDDGNAEKSGLYAFEYIMNSGRKILVPAYQFMYHGVRTDGIETYINETGGIESILRIAENKDTALTIEMTRNGLLIQSVVSPCQGQAKIVKQDCGLAVQNNWANGDPIKLVELTYEEYVELQNASLVCDCKTGGECVCEDNPNIIEKGCIYFIKNKNIMYLNGVKYGFAISDSNTVYMTKSETGEFMLNVKISKNSTNMLRALSDGLYSAMSWSGSKSNEILEVQYDNEDVYKSLDEPQKSRTIFICADSKKIYITGKDYSYVDIIGNPDDAEDKNTVYGYINSNIKNVVKYEEFESDGDKRKSITLENYDVLLGKKTDGSTVNLAMVSKWDKADYGSTTLPFNINGSEKRPTYNDDEEIALMKDIEEIKLPIEFNFPIRTLQDKVYTQEEIFAWFGVSDAAELKTLIVREGQFYLKYGIQLSGNPHYYRMPIQYIAFESDNQIKMVVIGLDTTNDTPTKYEIILNLDGTIAKDNSNIKVTSSDLVLTDGDTISALKAQIEEKATTEALNTEVEARTAKDTEIEAELAKKVAYTDVTTEDNPNRKAIVLNNHDTLLGRTTSGSAVNIAMISKWDKSDFGSAQLPFNMNGSEERPTYNDTEEVALLKDITDIAGKLEEISGKVSAIESKNIDEAIRSINQEIASIKERLAVLEGSSN